MKKTPYILLLVLLQQVLSAQKKDSCSAGVYITKEDFLNNRISHKIDKDAKGYKFGFPPPADWRLGIKITKPDTVLNFKPGSVYGYNECGKKYRYSAGGELYAPEDFYRVEEVKGLVIYTSVFVGGDEFFYSKDLTSQIHRLKVGNIERDFKGHQAFVTSVKELNKTGERGNIEKRDDKGNFIINILYAEKIKGR